MRAYFKVRQTRHAIITFPGTFDLVINVEKVRGTKQFLAAFKIPEMKLTRPQARQFVRACDMALHFAERAGAKSKGGGGGRVPVEEMNDGRTWFYADRSGSYRVSFDGKFIYVPGRVVDAAMLRRIQKLVGEAINWKVPKALRFLYNFRLGGW